MHARVYGLGRTMRRRELVHKIHELVQSQVDRLESEGDRLKVYGQVGFKAVNRGRRLEHFFTLYTSGADVTTCTRQ